MDPEVHLFEASAQISHKESAIFFLKSRNSTVNLMPLAQTSFNSRTIQPNKHLQWRINNNNNNNNNFYLLQLGCYSVAVVILHVNKT